MTDSHASAASQTPPATPFHDLDHFIALPRLSGLAVSRDGTRVVTSVSTLNPKQNAYRSALWELDPAGEQPARRITRSAKGETGAAFAASGDLYFTSARPDPDSADEEEPKAALWLIPAAGGEARPVAARSGGIAGLLTAEDADVVVVAAELLPGAADEAADAKLRALRKDTKVQAILHSGYPIRYWDSDLGPGTPHLLAVEPGAAGTDDTAGTNQMLPSTVDARPPAALRDLTPDIGSGLREAHPQLAPDGSFLLTAVNTPLPAADLTSVLARIDVATGERTVLLQHNAFEYEPGPISPDGGRAVVVVQRRSTPQLAVQMTLGVLDLAAGELTPLAAGWDRWARPLAWFPDGTSILGVADSDGRAPLFRIDVGTGEVTQLTHDDAAYSDAVPHPDGSAVFAVRSSYEYPAEVVRIDLASGDVTRLPNPAERPTLPGRLEEVQTTAADGSRVRGWLALPSGVSTESPAPLALWIHGGPLGSWNAWSWRWTPWNMVAQGYAVLLPDPALSTGYGQEFIQRGWGRWGAEPFTDLMSITDSVEARADIDGSKTVAMGGSFGGYMANWVAGHTDRFAAIVTHASLWALDQFGATTDMSMFWAQEMTPAMSTEFSPHRSVDKIVTPMLVVHGDRDYRVPIGEGLRLWYDLLAHSGLPAEADGSTVHRFLYFPDENHWVLTPQHAKVWYQVVLGFVNQHVRGDAPPLPATLGLVAPPEES
ncbi:S9 family peptidase [Nakamurella lactea]|uniref:S9 family peptidase n=1 Tax=Nakamurella lactea TaxID=459515 RepID=UPI00048F1962|nr:prolyl oligopeptidase family serine peptidase [Nakamurella lactea]